MDGASIVVSGALLVIGMGLLVRARRQRARFRAGEPDNERGIFAMDYNPGAWFFNFVFGLLFVIGGLTAFAVGVWA